MSAFQYLSVRPSGQIRIGRTIPKDRLAIVQVDDDYQAERLRRIVWGFARKAYEPNLWLVPGMPEADSLDESMAALRRWVEGLVERMERDLRASAWRVLLQPAPAVPSSGAPGDRGQRYEVSAFVSGAKKAVGWTGSIETARFMRDRAKGERGCERATIFDRIGQRHVQ